MELQLASSEVAQPLDDRSCCGAGLLTKVKAFSSRVAALRQQQRPVRLLAMPAQSGHTSIRQAAGVASQAGI